MQFHLAQSRAQSTPSLQPAPAWCSAVMGTDGDSLDRQQITGELRENSKNTPRGNSTLISELGEQSHRDVKDLGLSLCTE